MRRDAERRGASSAQPQASVVVTGAGSSTAMGVIKGLMRQRELQVRVVACDVEPLSAGAHVADAFHRVPTARDPAYLDEMLRVCAIENARLLVPIVDEEFLPLSRARASFEAKGIRIAISDESALLVCADKESMVRFFQSIDLAVPRTWRPRDRVPLPGDFPLILKPRLGGRGSLGVVRAADREEYEFHLRHAGDCIVQEFIEGEEYTIDTLSDFEGTPLAAVARLRLEVRSGISYKGIIVRDERMLDAACRIVSALRVVGAACIQCIVRGGDLFMIEINPRFGGATAFSIAGAGVNTPLLLARAAWGERVRPCVGQYRAGVTLLRYWDEVIVPPGAGAKGSSWT